ncbi:ATP-binding protein [Falsiroseomonas sp. HW251]|uniref:ATP-binding protein n=1 Tax=Falsiroseomonas sp. HW251 TaxID=3390998 RepID=UPI003D31A862
MGDRAESRWGLDALLRGVAGRTEAGPLLRAVLDASSPGLALLDDQDRLVAWNPELARLCGPTLPLRAGMPAVALIEPSLRDGTAAALDAGRRVEAALASAGAPQVQVERRPLPGREHLALLRVSALAAAEQTVRNAAAARLQSVGALAGGIAHDFNNLLSAIGGSAEAALAREPDGPAAPDLRQIMESAARGAALVRQLLAFARQQALQPRVVELNDAVGAMAALLRRLLGSRVRLSLELDEPGRRVRIDPTQLDQVIMNLALNARDAMPGGGSLRIATGHAVVLQPEPLGQEELPPGRYVTVEVSDTGGGIPPELLPRIFDPFFTTKREQGGSGLGLSTVHGIVRQSGGFIAAESRPGEGSTFRIWLPRHEGAADAAAPLIAAPVAAVPAAPPALPSGAPVLLVEDEPPLLRLAERALRRAGFEVMTATSAEEALEMLDTQAVKPAALVSDVVMPGLDGLGLAARLRERDPDLPVLLVSGYAEAALGRDLAAEKLRLLPKPYGLSDLVAELRAILPADAPAAAG